MISNDHAWKYFHIFFGRLMLVDVNRLFLLTAMKTRCEGRWPCLLQGPWCHGVMALEMFPLGYDDDIYIYIDANTVVACWKWKLQGLQLLQLQFHGAVRCKAVRSNSGPSTSWDCWISMDFKLNLLQGLGHTWLSFPIVLCQAGSKSKRYLHASAAPRRGWKAKVWQVIVSTVSTLDSCRSEPFWYVCHVWPIVAVKAQAGTTLPASAFDLKFHRTDRQTEFVLIVSHSH